VLPTVELPAKSTDIYIVAARQWYLYEHIRQFCKYESAKDLTCPKPVVPTCEKVILEKSGTSCASIPPKENMHFRCSYFNYVRSSHGHVLINELPPPKTSKDKLNYISFGFNSRMY